VSDQPEPELEAFLGDVTSNGSTDTDFEAFMKDFQPPDEGLKVEDAPPVENPFEDETVTIGDGACIVCGAPTFRPPGLTAAGHRKRVPKYCDLHKPGKRATIGQSPLAETELQRVQEELADEFKLGGMLIGAMLPVTGFYIVENADPFTIALVKTFKNNQRVLRVMHRMGQVAPLYELLKDGAGVAYAIRVDQKIADPHNMVGQRLGVARAYDSIYGSDSSNPNGSYSDNEPPRYARVN
jgi:hypothetical protein